MIKCCCCELEYIPDKIRLEEFPESNNPPTCDECFLDILKKHMESTEKKIIGLLKEKESLRKALDES